MSESIFSMFGSQSLLFPSDVGLLVLLLQGIDQALEFRLEGLER
jgi:hypothetical protein